MVIIMIIIITITAAAAVISILGLGFMVIAKFRIKLVTNFKKIIIIIMIESFFILA